MKDKKRLFQLEGGLMVPIKDTPQPGELLSLLPISSIERKTITIHESEWDEWDKIKGLHSWTTLMQTVREGYQFFKKVMANLTIKVQSGSYTQEIVGKPIERIKSSMKIPKLDRESPRAKVLAEIKKATEGKMSIKEFQKSLLKPLTKRELKKIQKSDKELEKAQKKRTRLEDLKTPK